MGSLFKQDAPPAPPPPPLTLVRDEVNNVEQVPVKNPDGSTTFVTRRIPLSASEQAERDELDRIADESLAEITRLSGTSFSPSSETQRRLDAWAEVRREALDDTFSERARVEDNTLARRGLEDSSAGLDVQRQRRLDRQEADVNIQREREGLVDDIRQQDIGLQQNLFNIATQQQDATLARETRAAAQGQSVLSRNNQFRQASLLNFYNAQLRQSLQPSTGDLFVQAFASSAGKALGSGF